MDMKYRWWVLQVIMFLVSIFFLLFGIDLLILAYTLNDPFNFIMTFFSASFVILISLTLAISFVIKMVRVWRQLQNSSS